MLRRARMLLTAVTAAGLLWGMGVALAYAGTNGQELSLRDINGGVNSAFVKGDNQNCYYFTFGISNWPNHDYDITGGYWWQNWSGCNPQYNVDVIAYSQINYGGNPFATFHLTGPPHSQTNQDWWTCKVDGQSACTSGKDAYG